MTAPICRMHVNTVGCGKPLPCPEHDKPAQSEWLRNVLDHCDRARSTSLATMRALGKSTEQVRKKVGP